MISPLSIGNSWYFIGIGGVSMSALAALFWQKGADVRGSDCRESEYTQRLRALGIPVQIGEEEHIAEQNVVYTEAVSPQNPQLCEARKTGKRLFTRAELLGRVAEEFSSVISVAGCHGKTSTTSMLAHIFSCANKNFTAHIGGEDAEFGNLCRGGTGDDIFVTEACEFRRSFLSLKSSVALILNTDKDHTDCYKSDGELIEAYRAFAGNAEKVVVNADDPRARNFPHALDFGFYSGDVRAEELRATGEKYRFTVIERGIPIVKIKLRVVGKYQVMNALAAYSVARLCGLRAVEIKEGLESFRGVKRRFEEVGTICGVQTVCDYAHHPRELAAAISAAQAICEGTVHVVFQPHTYTRTRDFMREFINVLKTVDSPILYKTYAAREEFEFEGSAVALLSRLPEACYVQTAGQLLERLKSKARKGDLILILGAGDIDGIARSLLDK